jgi:hypothetical protein
MRIFSVNAWRFALAVGIGRWDRFTSWGTKIKDGAESVFDEDTLGQMVENFASRKNDIAMCFDHQSAYVAENGQPAPALAWYSALALVVDGQVVKFAAHDKSVLAPDAKDFENGVYGYRSELTPLGEKLLPNYKYISPMFTDAGEDEQGNAIGYDLIDVAATNTPFQDGVGLTMHRLGAARAFANGAPMDPELMKKLGLADDAKPEECMAALKARFKKYEDDELANKKAMSDMEEKFKKMSDGDGDADDKKKMAKEEEDAAKKEMGRRFGLETVSYSRILRHIDAKLTGADEVAKMSREIAELKQFAAASETASKQEKAKLFAQAAIDQFRTTDDKRGLLEKVHVAEGDAEAEKLLFPVNTFAALKQYTAKGDPLGSKPAPGRLGAGDKNAIGTAFDAAVRARMEKDKITYSQAMDLVDAEQPHLYSR